MICFYYTFNVWMYALYDQYFLRNWGSLTDIKGLWAWDAGPHLLDAVLVSQVATAGMKQPGSNSE